MGGWLNTSCIVFSIRTIASVRYREVVRSWEGPLWEVPLYTWEVALYISNQYYLILHNVYTPVYPSALQATLVS